MKGGLGKLREYVTIEQPTETEDGHGGFAVTWSTFAQVWARIDPVAQRHDYHGDALERRVTHKIIIRELSDLTIKMRISFESRIFHILGFADMEERDRFVEIKCHEGDGVAS